MQRLSDADIPFWRPKLGAQIKGILMQNKILFNNILHVASACCRTFDLSNTLKNVELKTWSMSVPATPAWFNVLNVS